MPTLKVPAKTLSDSFLLQDYIDDFTTLNNEVNKLGNGVVNAPTIGFGMNSKIASNSPVSQFAKFVFTGRNYVNILGKDGNCEDVSKWGNVTCTLALDTAVRVFGTSGIKITSTSTAGVMSKLISSFNLDITKYYLFSAYVKNGNLATGISIQKDNSSGGVSKASSVISDTTKFNRVGFVCQPSDFNAANNLQVLVTGANTTYAYVDGIMVNEINAAEYALGATALLASYPYIDSYGCLTNPYVEIKHGNLVRNGNCEDGISCWIPSSGSIVPTVVSSKFQIVTTLGGATLAQDVNVKPNTNYYLSGNVSGLSGLSVWGNISKAFLKTGVGTFNTGSDTSVGIVISNSSVGTGTVDSVMLIEGTSAPTATTKYAPITDDYAGKVSGDNVVCANVAKRTYDNNIDTALVFPSGGTTVELGASSYTAINNLNGSNLNSSTNVNLTIPQHLFSFNIIRSFEDVYGTIPVTITGDAAIDLASKVQWLKDNVNVATITAYIFGSCPSGNKAYLDYWNALTSAWAYKDIGSQNSMSNTASTPTVMNMYPPIARIDSNGMLHILAYTDPSNGTIASTVNTDYVSLQLTFKSTQYQPCTIERQVAEVILTSDDTLTLENGVATGLLNYDHKTLYGRDFDWIIDQDLAGFKRIRYQNTVMLSNMSSTVASINTKYDGKILPVGNSTTLADRADFDLGGCYQFISIADTETGWSESFAPNQDEIKAFMNGWKCLVVATRAIAWVDIVDGSVPSGVTQCTVSAATNATSFSVTTGGTNIASGDNIVIVSATGALKYSTTSVGGTNTNTLIYANTIVNVVVGDIVMKADTATFTDGINFCKQTIAPNYDGYKLHYKFNVPKQITDANCHVHGEIPKINLGDNYIFVDAGMIIGEIVIPKLSGDTTGYIINSSHPLDGYSPLKNKVESLIGVYKNQIYESIWELTNTFCPYGNYRAWTSKANVDTAATYTVDYKMLATMAPSVGGIMASYSQDIFSAVINNTKAIENRQTHDVTLDSLIDLSLYEDLGARGGCQKPNNFGVGTVLGPASICIEIPMAQKRTIPKLNININTATAYNSAGATAIPFGDIKIYISAVTRNYVRLYACYMGSNATILSNMNSYGFNVLVSVIADCRERV